MSKRIKPKLAEQPSEYGSVCLAMITEYYGVQITPFESARRCCVTQDGCTMEQISEGATSLGFHATISEKNLIELKESDFPCIVTLDNSFAVLSKLTRSKAILFTPKTGRIKMAISDFERSLGKKVLFLSPDYNNFEKVKQPSPIAFALKLIFKDNLSNTLLYAANIIIVSLLLLFLTFIIGFFTDYVFADDYTLRSILGEGMSIFSDEWFDINIYTLSDTDYSALFYFVLINISLVLLILLELWSIPLFSHFATRVTSMCERNCTWSSINMPIDVYQIRSDGFFMECRNQVSELGYFLAKQMMDVLIRPLLALFFMLFMLIVSVPCFFIVLISIVVISLSGFISAKMNDKIGRVVFAEKSREGGFLLEGLKAIRSIRNSGSEFVFFRNYVELNRHSSKNILKANKLQNFFDDLPATASNITKLTLILVGAYEVYSQSISIGDLIYINGLYCIIADYLRSAVFSSQKILSISYKVECLQNLIIESEKFTNTDKPPMEDIENYSKLHGNIQLRNVSFGYSKSAGPVLKNINMDIPAGSRIALVGASGCGKTTLKKLICRRFTPWDGEILYDGIPSKDVPNLILVNSIASVDQQINMFEDTIMNNIKMWDTTQFDADAILAARDAAIHDEIIIRDGGYKSIISEDGINFSGGQRQRIEITRALSMDPSILVMDEATSALDTIVEKKIVDHVQARGITTIVIAHRLSTIKHCDCIYVMNEGQIIDHGTHEQLMDSCDLYRKLVTVE